MNRFNIKSVFLFSIFLLLFSLFTFAQEGNDYNSVIKSADEYYQKKDYYNAKAAYQLASKLKPEETYPKEKIQEIIGLLKAEMAIRGEYDEYIETADEAFSTKDYPKAIEYYEKALGLIAYEEHPNKRLEESRQLLEAAILKQNLYEETIKTADEHFAKQEYEQALSFYRDAANVDEDQKYPNDQILKITNLLKNQAQNQQAYESAILQADQQLNYQKFQEALGQYELALQAKPADEYATKQVAKMKEFIELEKQYDQITAKADELYVAQDLQAAKAEYRKAMKVLPEKTYALNMIDKIDANLNKEVAKQQKLDEDYNKAITDGDELFNAKKYQSAYSKYSKALELKPNEEYPQKQLEEINIFLASGYVEISCFVHENNKGLFDSRVQLQEGGRVLETAEIGTNGRHKFKLDLNKNYILKFYKDDYVQKIFDINTSLPRNVDHNTIYTYELPVELFQVCATDLSILDEPLAEIKYFTDKGNFYFDEQRAQIVINKINALKKDCEEIREKEAQQEEYNKLIADADKNLGLENYAEAIENYSAASNILPNEEYPKQKITDINQILEAADKYQALIVSGDAKFNAKSYDKALFDYYEAKNMKPNEEYPQQKIAEIDAILNAQKAIDSQYEAQVKQADSLFGLDSLVMAKNSYELALEIKKEEAYPKSQISLINTRLKELEEINKRYQDAIANADKLFERENFNDARAAYLVASQIKPGEMYPKYKIEDINTIEEQRRIRALNDNYTELIAQADAEFENKVYLAALELYQRAGEVKPKETYPVAQIEIINGLLAEIEANNQKYEELIVLADQEFAAKSYAPSFDNYKAALALKPEEEYPQQKMAEIEAIMKEMADLELAYQEAVKKGDEQFELKTYTTALQFYQQAAGLKPEESYPPQKIAEIDGLLQALADKDAAYNAAIAQADQQFAAEDWNNSKGSYESALAIKSEEQYPKDQIVLIDEKLAAIAQQQANLQAQYEALIAEGDQLFAAEQLLDSKTKFQEAASLKPEESYPPQKIAEIDDLLQALADKDAAYNAAIAQADEQFAAEDWNNSKASYESALAIKSEEQYPKDQIVLIDEKLAAIAQQQADLQAQYEALIAEGDQLFAAEQLLDSKTKFQEAAGLKPEESYPPQKIAEIDGLLQALADKDAAYNAAIAQADQQFAAEDWNNSKSSYESALAIKSGEQYPKDQIVLIDQKLDEIAQLQAQYETLIAEGDQLLAAEQLIDSKTKFQEAASLKPEESYPPQKIAEIDGLLQALADKDAAYNAALAQADQQFEAEDWNNSKGSYESALAIKSGEQYPKDQIILIDQKLAAIAQKLADLQAQYEALIAEGDQLLAAEQLLDSKTKFQEAASLKPEETYPPQKIAEIDGLLQELADKDAAYAATIEKADRYFGESEWNMALTAYQEATDIKPGEQYPKDQIEAINLKLQEIADLQAQYEALIATADQLFNNQTYVDSKGKYQEALAIKAEEQYPKDKITEIDGILKQMADQEALYQQLIQSGDVQLAESSYNPALSSYKQALEIKAEEQYPKDKIAEIEAILLEISEKERKYTEAIQLADQNRDQESWEQALGKYEEALGIKAEEQYPKDQIALINQKLQELADLQAAYDAAIAKADKEFESKDWQTSLGTYQSALEIKQNEVYPQTQIQEINRILKEIADNEAAYQQAIAEADGFFKSEDWQSALTKYELASSLKAEEQYPKDKIAELNGILGELAAQQAKYDALIQEGDQFFTAENYTSATSSYQAALEIKANETYPQSQLTKIEEILAQLAEVQKQYDALIKEGDKQFVKEEWGLALAQYQQASELKTEEVYPKEQINIINEKLQAIADKKAQFDALVAEADQFYQSAEYETSLTKYEAALVILPNEQYPKDQMKAIRDLLEELAKQNAEYNKVIAKADDLLLQESFEKSKEQYQEALGIFPERPYPQEQIAKIDDLIEKHTQYNSLVESGDEQFKNKEYEAALSSFINAVSLLPEKTYPPQKIAEIEQILEMIALTRTAYDAAIAKADAHLAAEEYEPAKLAYQEALEQISTEVYPRQKIMEIDQILADLARKRVQFDKVIAQANKAFDDKSYDVSLGKYQEAQGIFPEEPYPQQRIDEINGILAQMANQKERYESLVAQGDKAFGEEDYSSSIQMFQQALAIYPNETYPPQKITEAEAALAKIQRELDIAYQKAVDAGDRSFRKRDWDPAKESYQKASEIKPEELYPKEKLAEINKMLEEELLAQQKEYDRYIADGERFYSTKYYQEAILSFEKALGVFPFEKYPAEMIDKIFEMIKKTSMLTLLDGKMTLNQNKEEKFKFNPIAFKDRSENYILVEVKRLDPDAQVKLFINFGKGGSKNGGYSIPLKSKDGYHSYFVSIGKQVRWVNQDNDYISLLPEGGDVEVKLIKLSRNGI